MNFISFFLVSLVVAYTMLRGLKKQAGVLQFPFLISATMAGWFLPQALLLIDQPNMPSFGYSLTMIYAALSIAAIVIADKQTKVPKEITYADYDNLRLLMGSATLSVVGATSYFMILRTPASQTAEGLTTGIVTIYFFFFSAQFFGLAAALLVYLRKFSILALSIVLFNYFTLGGFVLFGGRRGAMVELVLITLCALFFCKRIIPSRAIMIIGVLVLSLFFNAVGEYRSKVVNVNVNASPGNSRLPTIKEILEIDFLGRFIGFDERRTDEVRNAIFEVSAATETLGFNFGIKYWNYIVFRYIPGQLIGHEFKETIQISDPYLPAKIYGYRPHIGTTHTGLADSFGSFFLFGALVFFRIAALFRRLWLRGSRGSFRSQYFYCILITSGLHGMTHGTVWFVAALPQAFIFSWLLFAFAKKSNGTIRNVES